MTSSSRSILFLVFCILLTACCRNEVQCPELTLKVDTYIPYQIGSAPLFENMAGNIISFDTLKSFQRTNPAHYDKSCKFMAKGNPDCSVTKSLFVHADYLNYLGNGRLAGINWAVSETNHQLQKDKITYDLYVSVGDLSASFALQSQNPDSIDLGNLPNNSAVYYFKNILLNQKSFQNVYLKSFTDSLHRAGSIHQPFVSDLYFSISKGVIAFRTVRDSSLYVIKE